MPDDDDYPMGDSPIYDEVLGCMVRPSQRDYLRAAQAVNSGSVHQGPVSAKNFIPAPKPPDPKPQVTTQWKARKQRDLTDEEAALL